MRRVAITLLTFALGAVFAVLFLNGRNVEGQAQPAAAAGGFSAVPNAVGTQDVTGPYEVVKGWPKDISTLPGNQKWTYGAGESVFAETTGSEDTCPGIFPRGGSSRIDSHRD